MTMHSHPAVLQLSRFLSSLILCLALASVARAGGPLLVAGNAPFAAAVKGQPLTWPSASLTYFTDQGDLSPVLPQAAADALVADAFSSWTRVSTALFSATRGGQLAEDVSGANVSLSGQTITLPVDIQPTAIQTPLAVVYDVDGAVTDALLGQGASADCVNFSAFGGPDNFDGNAHFAHAIVILNGTCVVNSSQIPDLRARLVRILGRTLGLGWSQLNLNVLTATPLPSAADLAGFPVMHAREPLHCEAITACLPAADQLRPDDRSAFSQLYPAPAFKASTARIHGTVRFSATPNGLGQPMQGVNVVASWIDPTTGQPSRTFTWTSVSGFRFRGNAGNAVTGFTDALGLNFDRFGSDDPALEGTFDLAGLASPDARNLTLYQISVEPLDSVWSNTVGPYNPLPVQPSGQFNPVAVNAFPGTDTLLDIQMVGTPTETRDWTSSTTFVAPAPVPGNGEWLAALAGYGNSDYYQFPAEASRTLTIEVTALDEKARPTLNKAQPVIGLWSLPAPEGTPPPAATPTSFNSSNFAMSSLNAVLLGTGDFRIGVADLRGDGRPDFRYHLRVLYADSVQPARVSAAGDTPITISGLGFATNTGVAAGVQPAQVLSLEGNQLSALAPPLVDGTLDLSVIDPATAATSVMTGALTAGAASTDVIHLIPSPNPAVPVGGQTITPIRFQVLEADGTTPVAGATVVLSATSGAALSACSGLSSCSLFSDEAGLVGTNVGISAIGMVTLIANLAPASYSPPSSAQTTISGTASTLDLVLFNPRQWMAQGSTDTVPLQARVLSLGTPQVGNTINFSLVSGLAQLTVAAAVTDANGFASSAAAITSMGATDVQINACVAPNNAPCQKFTIASVDLSVLQIQPVSGSGQARPRGQPFAPVVVRVTDSAVPPDPVRAFPVEFFQILARAAADPPPPTDDIPFRQPKGMPVIIGTSLQTVTTDMDGLATVQPPTLSQPLKIFGTASAGAAQSTFLLEVADGPPPVGSGSKPNPVRRVPPLFPRDDAGPRPRLPRPRDLRPAPGAQGVDALPGRRCCPARTPRSGVIRFALPAAPANAEIPRGTAPHPSLPAKPGPD
jgi:hypothetical protein